MWLLRDPLELAEMQLVMASPLAQVLVYCNGTRDIEGIRDSLAQDLGVAVDIAIIKDAINQLDKNYLLQNDRSQRALEEQLEHYMEQKSRPPSLAGLGYPADPYELTTELMAYGEGDDLTEWAPWSGRGLISPHIDYPRGGDVYSRVWRRAEFSVKQADVAIIFGTDHYGREGSITLTSKPYETPFGVLPIDLELNQALEKAIGPEAYDEELHHRKEHSVELSATWLHFISDRRPLPVIPVLCGSFNGYYSSPNHPKEEEKISSFIEALREETADKRVLAVASVDLAHVGPNFGDSFIMDFARRQQLVHEDELLIEAVKRGDAEEFFQQIASVDDRNRICGASSIYLLLRYLGATSGELISYKHCPADPQNTSLVSICGMLLE